MTSDLIRSLPILPLVISICFIVTTDGTEDMDGDRLDTFGEYMQQTDPHDPDTDGEGMPDGWEVTH